MVTHNNRVKIVRYRSLGRSVRCAPLTQDVMFQMAYRKFRLVVWLAALVVPLCLHVYAGYSYAAGGYDGKHCAGLLDAVWECTEFEYYLSYLFNPFVIINLVVYYAVSLVLSVVSLRVYKKWFIQDTQKT